MLKSNDGVDMKATVWMPLRWLMAVWMAFFGAVLLSHAALVCPCENLTTTAYDDCAKVAFGYDGGETHVRNGSEHRLCGNLALFAKSPEFLAAEGTLKGVMKGVNPGS